MRPTLLALTGLICAALWLALLSATDFSMPVLGTGLLGMFALIGKGS